MGQGAGVRPGRAGPGGSRTADGPRGRDRTAGRVICPAAVSAHTCGAPVGVPRRRRGSWGLPGCPVRLAPTARDGSRGRAGRSRRTCRRRAGGSTGNSCAGRRRGARGRVRPARRCLPGLRWRAVRARARGRAGGEVSGRSRAIAWTVPASAEAALPHSRPGAILVIAWTVCASGSSSSVTTLRYSGSAARSGSVISQPAGWVTRSGSGPLARGPPERAGRCQVDEQLAGDGRADDRRPQPGGQSLEQDGGGDPGLGGAQTFRDLGDPVRRRARVGEQIGERAPPGFERPRSRPRSRR